MAFSTANGEARAIVTCPLRLKELGYATTPYVLDSTPPVLSVGRRVRHGVQFHWISPEEAYFVSPKGEIIPLVVIDDIPYLKTGTPMSKPRAATETRTIPCGTAMQRRRTRTQRLEHLNDTWSLMGNTFIRHHYVHRKSLVHTW